MADDEDVTVRTLIRKVVVTDVNVSAVRPNTRSRLAEASNVSSQRRITSRANRTINLDTPSMVLRNRIKARVRRSARLTGTGMKSLPYTIVTAERPAVAPLMNLDDPDTPRTILSNFKLTEPIVVPPVLKVHPRGDQEGSKSETRLEKTQNRTLKLDLDTPAVPTSVEKKGLTRKPKKLRLINVEDFKQRVEQNLHQLGGEIRQEESRKDMSSLSDSSGMARSFKMGLDTLSEPESVEKKGLVRRPKKHRIISQENFEGGVEQNFQQLKGRDWFRQEQDHSKDNSALSNSSGMRSFKLGTPSDPESVQKKGLARRPKKKRFISQEHFEGEVEQNLQHLKGSQECYIDPSFTAGDGSLVSTGQSQNNTDIVLSNTALYARPVSTEWNLQASSFSKSLRSRSLYTQDVKDASSEPMLSSDIVSAEVVSVVESKEQPAINYDEEHDVPMEDEVEEQVDINDGGKYDVSMDEEKQMETTKDSPSKTVSMEDVDFEYIDRMGASDKKAKSLSSTNKLNEYSEGITFGNSLLRAELVDSVFQSSATAKNMSRPSGAVPALRSTPSSTKLMLETRIPLLVLSKIDDVMQYKSRGSIQLINDKALERTAEKEDKHTKEEQEPASEDVEHEEPASEDVEHEEPASEDVAHEEPASEDVEHEEPVSEVEEESSSEEVEEDESALEKAEEGPSEELESEESASSAVDVKETTSQEERMEELTSEGEKVEESTNEEQEVEESTSEEGEEMEDPYPEEKVKELTHEEEVEELCPEEVEEETTEEVVAMEKEASEEAMEMEETTKESKISEEEQSPRKHLQSTTATEAPISKSKGSRISSPAFPLTPRNLSRRSGPISSPRTDLPANKEGHPIMASPLGSVNWRIQHGQRSDVSQDEEEEQMVKAGGSVSTGSRIASPADPSTPRRLSRRSDHISSPRTERLSTKEGYQKAASPLGRVRRRTQSGNSSDASQDEEEGQMMYAGRSASRGSRIASPAFPLTPRNLSRRSGPISSPRTDLPANKEGHQTMASPLRSVNRRTQHGQRSDVSQDEEEEQMVKAGGSVSTGSRISSPADPSTPRRLSRRSGHISSSRTELLATKEGYPNAASPLGRVKRSTQSGKSSDASQDEEGQMMNAGGSASRGSRISSPAFPLTPRNLSRRSGPISSPRTDLPTNKEGHQIVASPLISVNRRTQHGQSSDVSQEEEEEQMVKAGGSVSTGSRISSPADRSTPRRLSRRSGHISSPRTELLAIKEGYLNAASPLGRVKRRTQSGKSSDASQDEEGQMMNGERSASRGSRISSPAFPLTPRNLSRRSGPISSPRTDLPANKEGHQIVASPLGSVNQRTQHGQSSDVSQDEEEEQMVKAGGSVSTGSRISSPADPSTPRRLSRHSRHISPRTELLAIKEGFRNAASPLGRVKRRTQSGKSSDASQDDEGGQMMNAGRSASRGPRLSSPAFPSIPMSLKRRSGPISTPQTERPSTKRHQIAASPLGNVKKRAEGLPNRDVLQDWEEEQMMNAGGSVRNGSRISSPAFPSTPKNLSRHSGPISTPQTEWPSTKEGHRISASPLGKVQRRAQSGQSRDVLQDEQVMDAGGSVSKGFRISSFAFPSTHTDLSRKSGTVFSPRMERTATKQVDGFSAGTPVEDKRKSQSGKSSNVAKDQKDEQMMNARGSVSKGHLFSSHSLRSTPVNQSRGSAATSTVRPEPTADKQGQQYATNILEEIQRTIQSWDNSSDESQDEEQMMNAGRSVSQGARIASRAISLPPDAKSRRSGSMLTSLTERSGARQGDWSRAKSRASIGQSDVTQYEEEDQSTDAEGTNSEELTLEKDDFVPVKKYQGGKLSTTLTSPHYFKTSSAKFPIKRPIAKRAPKKTNKAPKKKECGFTSRFVKETFTHYAKVPVAKDSYRVVEQCLNTYLKQMIGDLEAFAGHAGRKIVNASDIELLMRRQGLVTDNMPMHIHIERHLPMEYRKLLIPIATSGNIVVPK